MKNARIVTLVLMVATCFFLIIGCRSENDMIVVSSNSFFDKMIISNDRVYFICYIELINDSDSKKSITITGESEEDVKNGLLTESSLEFYVLETDAHRTVDDGSIDQLIHSPECIDIDAHSIVNYWICFIGNHSYGQKKHDRNIPKVNIRLL